MLPKKNKLAQSKGLDRKRRIALYLEKSDYISDIDRETK